MNSSEGRIEEKNYKKPKRDKPTLACIYSCLKINFNLNQKAYLNDCERVVGNCWKNSINVPSLDGIIFIIRRTERFSTRKIHFCGSDNEGYE